MRVNPTSRMAVLLLAFSMVACARENDAAIDIAGLNYTNDPISTFSVNGHPGPGIYPNNGGGAFVCCVIVPRKWSAGMKVTIRWTKDERIPSLWKEQIVEVPKYATQDIGAFVVHFYPDNIVKVLVTVKMEGHPDYPYPRPN